MKIPDGLIITGDALLCLGALIRMLSGAASTDDYVVFYFTVSILAGYIARYVVKAKRKHESSTTKSDE